ncbi:MAG TPA: hypothetical protein VIT01_19635 [Acidimicrobiales bacterium]
MAIMDVRPDPRDDDLGQAALDRLLVLRETVAEVLDLPTVARTRAMLSQARDVLSDGLAAGDEAVDESRRLLAEDLNIVSWLTPGSRGFIDAVGAFRHRLFAHLGLLQKARR